jgi:hypothetical protein
MIKINPRWEIEEGKKSEMVINWQVAIGRAIRKSMKYGQQKQNEPDFSDKNGMEAKIRSHVQKGENGQEDFRSRWVWRKVK